MEEIKNKHKKVYSPSDIKDLRTGDIVSFLKFGEMLYYGKLDKSHIFWGRNKHDKESIRELWFSEKQLIPYRGEMGYKLGFIEEMYYNVTEAKKPLYNKRDKSLREAGL